MGSGKCLEVTVRLKGSGAVADFAERAVAAVQEESRIDAFARFDAAVLSVVWYPDLDRAAELIGRVTSRELVWSEPEIVYRYEDVESAGRTKRIVLEPILLVEVESPRETLGTVMGDLSSRRGQLTAIRETDAGTSVVSAEVPLSELRGYSTDMLRLTEGRGIVGATLLRYVERPAFMGPSDEPVSVALRA